ncbi:MAG: hypothetical protein LJE87_04145 [Deltaproteobacteria bacterium]|nr:hypothetical protein [Deltaproteobacteria bacterium]
MRLFVLLAEVCQSDEALQNIKYQPANPSVIGVGFQVSGVRKEKSKTETSSAGKAIELWIGFKGWVFDVDERLDSISQRGH